MCYGGRNYNNILVLLIVASSQQEQDLQFNKAPAGV